MLATVHLAASSLISRRAGVICTTAWVQLGKVANPATGKVDRNLEAAKGTIDVLGSLEEKTKGNLNDEEEKLLTRMLLDLRMNYVEETKRGDTETQSPEGAGDPCGGTARARAADG